MRVEVKPSGAIFVYAPSDADLRAIEAEVDRKGFWVFSEIDRVSLYAAPTSERQYISGETHLLLGRQYRLVVEPSSNAGVVVDGRRLVVFARRCDDQVHCRRLLKTFYARTARQIFHERLDAVRGPFLLRGMKSTPLIVRPLAKRWGRDTPAGALFSM